MLQSGRVVFHHVCDYHLLKKDRISCSLLVDYYFVSVSCQQLRFRFYLKVWEHPSLATISAVFHSSLSFSFCFLYDEGHVVAHLVGALRYELESSGFDSRWVHWLSFIDLIFPVVIWPFGSTQPLTEIRTTSFSCGVKVRTADNLTTFMCRLSRNCRRLSFLEPKEPV